MSYPYDEGHQPRTTLEELRDRVPTLHPYAALVLTLEPMLVRGEIRHEQYIELAAVITASQNKPLFSDN